MISSSGIGRYLRSVLCVLHDEGYRMIALGDEVSVAAATPGIFSDVIRYNQSVYNPRMNWEVPALVPECDVYFSPHFTVPFIKPKAKHVITTVHDLFHLDAVSGFGLFKRAYSRSMIATAAKTSDIILTVSDFSRGELMRHFCFVGPKVRVVPNCIDRNLFFMDEQRPSGVSLPFILFVGNLKPHKNLITAIRATENLSCSDIKLIVAGVGKGFIHGPDKKMIEHLADKHVIHLEFVADAELRRLYSAASCLVFPSLYEGFGYPSLEAMACGCPVVCSNIPALRETCGDAALYCEPLDEEGFRKNIETILSHSDIHDRLVNRGQERVVFFSFERFSGGIRKAFGEYL